MTTLREPFPDDQVRTLDKGKFKVRYVNHAQVTDRLLQVDPEWTWEPMGHDENGAPYLDQHGGLWIYLTVNGVTRPGYGDPQNAGSSNAVKEAISDAIRNAAMRFGVALDLWMWMGSSGPTPAPATEEPVPDGRSAMYGMASRGQVAKIQVLLANRGIMDRDHRLAGISTVVGREVDSTKNLTAAEAHTVIETLTRGSNDG